MQSAAAARGGAPQWLRRLLSEEFFDACPAHPGERKNDKNHLCVDCAAALCRHCLPHEPAAHDVLQIWKYASCFVVRVDDLRLFDCTGIQSHTVSDHEVVFLNERTARKRSASPENPCAACARPLLSGHDYCSLFCKVKHLGESEHGLRRALRVVRQDEAATPETQSGKRRPSSSSDAGAGLSCGGSFRKRSRKQPEPAQAPFR
ncbi:hypothetical protein U9M48_022528 [Paspalum notatum var. saurae]|uniref:PLATZ transcription factor family protein n=1 Tax=Paspalum notatum var. saurae TaxID=547442 RepID=A0AAQ3TME2_PASNO